MRSGLALVEPTDSGAIDEIFRKTIRHGEERLLLAVLENAIEDYQKNVLATDRRGKELFQQAEEWIFETGSPSFFSFENICAHLNLDAGYVRRGFVRWKAAAMERSVAPNGKKCKERRGETRNPAL